MLKRRLRSPISNNERRSELDVMRKMLDYCLKERVVPGTDSGVGSLEFGHLDYDLQLLIECGFTPAEALVAATRVSAEAAGNWADEVGTIEVGKSADLAAFGGDPTADVAAFSDVRAGFPSRGARSIVSTEGGTGEWMSLRFESRSRGLRFGVYLNTGGRRPGTRQA